MHNFSTKYANIQIRYCAAIAGENRKMYNKRISSEVVSAVLESPATEDTPAKYISKEEAEKRLEDIYEKYKNLNVWSSAGSRVSFG